jgi:hypothetical protein
MCLPTTVAKIALEHDTILPKVLTALHSCVRCKVPSDCNQTQLSQVARLSAQRFPPHIFTKQPQHVL